MPISTGGQQVTVRENWHSKGDKFMDVHFVVDFVTFVHLKMPQKTNDLSRLPIC
jgi:hypothetical protein